MTNAIDHNGAPRHLAWLIWDGYRARKEGAVGIARRQRERLAALLKHHGLTNVQIERGSEPPKQTHSGKFRNVIPLKPKGP